MAYHFTLRYTTAKKFNIEIDIVALYGYWEWPDGEEGGGLWFDDAENGTKLELIDYDGVACIDQSIIDTLRKNGIICDDIFD